MLKILVVNTVKVTIDGINNVILNYFKNIKSNEAQMDFVFINEPYPELREYIISRGSKYTVINSRLKRPFKYAKKLAETAKGYDIVHAHGNSCTLALEMFAAKKAGVPVRIAHSHNSSNRFKLLHYALRPLFDSCVTDGFACGELAGKWLFGDKDFQIISNGIETSKFSYDKSVREQYRKSLDWEDKVILGHVGNFFPRKNDIFLIDLLYELNKRSDKYVLVSIGNGNTRKNVEQHASELGISSKVCFTGLRRDANKFMQAMDIFVLPSLYEGLPLTLVEAQAAGLRCIVSDTVTKEMDFCGKIDYLSLSDGVEKWADFIESLSERDREQLSVENVEAINRAGYGIERSSDRLLSIYRELVRKRRNR